MKKRTISLIIVLTLFILQASVNAQEEISPFSVSAQSAVMIEASTGRILYAKEENKRLSMASTTKIMTALLTLENENLDEYFEVDSNAIMTEGTSMGLKQGDMVSLRGLAYGMLLQSGNDAANAAAVKIGGSIDSFLFMMNERAIKLGMDNTHFVTPSGLDDEQHYSTSLDMAKLAVAALSNPEFSEICKQKSATIEYGNPPYARTITNHNRLLRENDAVIGIKTGFTKKSGRCLVSAMEQNEVRLIVVTLNAPDDWNDHRKLYDYGFSAIQPLEVNNYDLQIQIPVVGGQQDAVTAVEAFPIKLTVTQEQMEQVEKVMIMDHFVYAPLEAGVVVGRVEYVFEGKLLGYSTLVTAEKVEQSTAEPKLSLCDKIKQFFSSLFG